MALRQVKDTPTNNFATINPLNAGSSVTTSNGNLSISSNEFALATIAVSSGRWYYETHVQSTDGGQISVAEIDKPHQDHYVDGGDQYNCFGLYANGESVRNGVYTPGYTSAYGADTILGCCFDLELGKIWFSLNGNWVNGDANSYSDITAVAEAYSGLSGRMCPRLGHYNNDNPCTQNFGQNPDFCGNKTTGSAYATDANGLGSFYYQPPTGALALCSRNIQSVEQNGSYVQNYTSAKGNFRAVTYDGNNSQKVEGVGFKPDLVWVKARDNGSWNHQIHDSVRGASDGMLATNSANQSNGSYHFDSFDNNGFTTNSSNISGVNNSGNKFVAWCWKAGDAPTSDNPATEGSAMVDGTPTKINDIKGSATITPKKMSVNTKAGFSIVKYTGRGNDNDSIPHGLTKEPDVFIYKKTSATSGWMVKLNPKTYSAVSNENQYLYLNLTNPFGTNSSLDGSGVSEQTILLPDTIKFTKSAHQNESGVDLIAYCWHSVPGYSSIGSYTGNGSTDGPFIYTGHKIAFLLLKRTDSTNQWYIGDSAREPHNPAFVKTLSPNLPNSESNDSAQAIDFLSNGAKVRTTQAFANASGGTYIYAAFAEQPGAFSNAR